MVNLIAISSVIVWTFIIIVLVYVIRKPIAAGPWHDVTRGLPLKGIPVLTEYVSPSIGYHGFRVDTYSTRLNQWVEATVWDQKVIAYSEIKSTHKHKERMKSISVADGTHCVKCGETIEPPTQWPRK